MADFDGISLGIQEGKRDVVVKLVQEAVSGGAGAGEILEKGLIAGMNIVGRRFKNNEIYVPEVLIAARAMNAALQLLEPLLVKEGVKPVGRVAIGTVKGDLHDIGKNLVGMMLKGAGFQVTDLGVDVAPEKFVDTAKAQGAQLIGLSALLTTTMVNMKSVIHKMREAGLKTPVVIGGAPITQEYADEIQADGYAPDAATAVEVAKKVLGV